MNFRVGYQVICIERSGKWMDPNDPFNPAPGPSFGDVLVIKSFEDGYFLVFEEYGKDGYPPESFRLCRPRDFRFVSQVLSYVSGRTNKNEFSYDDR